MIISSLFSVRKQLYFLIFLLFSLSSSAQVYFNNMEQTPDSGNWIGLQTIDSGYAFSGNYYSHTDSLVRYGVGIQQKFPHNLVHNNTTLIISGYVMTSHKNNSALYVVTIVNDNKETTLWKGIQLSKALIDTNNWYYFSDSILIPASLTVNSKIKTYLWNQNKKVSTNIDDLKFEFRQFKNPSFLPAIVVDEVNSQEKKSLFSNNFYSISYSPKDRTISILDNNNEEVIQNLYFYTDKKIRNNGIILQTNWKLTGIKNIDNGKIIKFKTSVKGSSYRLNLICNYNTGEIKIEAENKYRKKQDIWREAIVFKYSQPVSEVYRNNRKIGRNQFQNEYWLDNEGVKIGENTSSFFIYHVPEISSLQLDTENQLLFANLDYEKDHPFFRFPLNPDSINWKKEESESNYRFGDNSKYSFSIFIGNNTSSIPRFMKNPTGYEATYIWTEHADFSDIRTNRATYFGSENITDADSATGGFVYYNIPVTKSVFYDNPDSITNYEASNGTFNSLESTVLTDTAFSDFLFQISAKGNDICLHTPEQYTTTNERFKDALLYMQMNYGSPSWIDHGNNNGPQNNREDLICDATLKKSPFYAIDIWSDYGVKYLHNAYYEEYDTFGKWQFENSMEKPYSGYGDFIPKPDYYLHPTKSKNLYHWTTTSALFVKDHHLWNYLFNQKKLENLVDNWYVEMNHVYPAWVDPKKGMWTYDSDSTIIAQPGLNQSLANLASLRDEGRLNITTIADYLDYRTAIDNVEYELLSDGRVSITNNNDFIIEDLSMAAQANAVTVDQLIPSYKKTEDDIIFWFNLAPGESKIIRIIK